MKELEWLDHELKQSPKYTLDDKKKTRVLNVLKNHNNKKQKKLWLKPVAAIIFAFSLIGVILLNQFDLFHQGKNGHHLETIMFSSPKGERFIVEEHNYTAIGIQGKIGILDTFENFVANDKRRVSKIMLYFWGNSEKLVNKKFRVEAKSDQNENITLAKGMLMGPLYSEDAHTLTSFQPFTHEGTWELSFYIEDQRYSAFTVEVLPPLPKTKDFTLLESPKEIGVGKESVLNLEGTTKKDEGVEVQLLDEEGNVLDHSVFIQDVMYYDSETLNEVFGYTGTLTFPYKGTFILEIDGERTKPFQN